MYDKIKKEEEDKQLQRDVNRSAKLTNDSVRRNNKNTFWVLIVTVGISLANIIFTIKQSRKIFQLQERLMLIEEWNLLRQLETLPPSHNQ